MPNKRRTVAIIGLGTFGSVIARELTRMGDRVVGLDRDAQRASVIADEIDSALQVDATDIKALKQCGLESCDSVIVSIGEDLQSSILVAMNIVELGCEKVWVKSQSAAHTKILKAIGISNIVRPELDYGLRVAQSLHNPLLSDYLRLGEDRYLGELQVPQPFVGQPVSKLGLESHDLICVGVFRGTEILNEQIGDTTLETDDQLILFGRRLALRKFSDAI